MLFCIVMRSIDDSVFSFAIIRRREQGDALMESLIIIAIIGLIAWFWQDSLRTRERAIRAAAQACHEVNVQLLDQTVSLESIKPIRNKRGRLVLQRIYSFDFSAIGYERRSGRTIMAGQSLRQVQLDNLEGGTTIEQE